MSETIDRPDGSAFTVAIETDDSKEVARMAFDAARFEASQFGVDNFNTDPAPQPSEILDSITPSSEATDFFRDKRERDSRRRREVRTAAYLASIGL